MELSDLAARLLVLFLLLTATPHILLLLKEGVRNCLSHMTEICILHISSFHVLKSKPPVHKFWLALEVHNSMTCLFVAEKYMGWQGKHKGEKRNHKLLCEMKGSTRKWWDGSMPFHCGPTRILCIFNVKCKKIEIPANWVPRCLLNVSSRPTCHIEQTAPENSLFWPHFTLRETCALSWNRKRFLTSLVSLTFSCGIKLRETSKANA